MASFICNLRHRARYSRPRRSSASDITATADDSFKYCRILRRASVARKSRPLAAAHAAKALASAILTCNNVLACLPLVIRAPLGRCNVDAVAGACFLCLSTNAAATSTVKDAKTRRTTATDGLGNPVAHRTACSKADGRAAPEDASTWLPSRRRASCDSGSAAEGPAADCASQGPATAGAADAEGEDITDASQPATPGAAADTFVACAAEEPATAGAASISWHASAMPCHTTEPAFL